MTREAFVQNVLAIAGEKPRYRLGGDGSDGTCDCVGLCIGALRRGGITYKNLHGTNWAARHEALGLRKIDSVRDLSVGDTVLKAYEPGEDNWNLPERYADDSDQRDYYHAGVVVSVNPLRIVHMTSPTAKTDTTRGRWRYIFLWRQLSQADTTQEEIPMSSTLYKAKVCTQEDPLTLRNAPEGSKIGVLPRDAVVDVLAELDTWAYVRYENKRGYASMKYLEPCESEKEHIDDIEPDGQKMTIIDSAGHHFEPKGDFRVLIGSID